METKTIDFLVKGSAQEPYAEERLSSLIRKLRGDKSQRQFAKFLGVSYAAVRSWEESESMPGLNSLEKIADYSNQTLEELLQYLKDEGDDQSKVLLFPKVYLAEDLFGQVKELPRKEQSRLAQFLIEELSK
jgi:transcriptional regulator with XRE-family HTH domain